ncbi:MAG: bacteriohemerythrin [Planctomycetota bacterium]|jgi:hemerythrin-like metal-binding protein
MALIEWDKSYSVGDHELDTHHQKLIGIIIRLGEHEGKETEAEVVEEILFELTDYLDYHFRAEEERMRDAGYPELARHRKIHEGFMSRVLFFQRAYRDKKATLARDLLQFLKTWLINHIIYVDQQYALFFATEGEKKVPTSQ